MDGTAMFFAYDNAASVPVVVPEGDRNTVAGVAEDDNPLLTTLFAPGRVDAAFWVYFPGVGPVVWTLTGPDGVEREAVGDETLPNCPDEYPGNSVVDPRTPELKLGKVTPAADGASVEVELELTGVPEASVCNSAFDPEQVLASLGDGNSLPSGYETTRTVVAGPFYDAQESGVKLATVYVYPLVVDRCTAEGVTVLSWPVAEALRALTLVSSAPAVCARLDAAGALTVELYGSCESLPTTGGSSIRPR